MTALLPSQNLTAPSCPVQPPPRQADQLRSNDLVAPLAEVRVGDNLLVLKAMASELVYLVYLDPPYGSQREYYRKLGGGERELAYTDTWRWTEAADEGLARLSQGTPKEKLVASYIDLMIQVEGRGRQAAYLVFMAPRLVELHRVLRRTGSFYLQCDTTASHDLKKILDVIFGSTNFRSEITWKRSQGHHSGRRPGRNRDVILLYSKSGSYTWNNTTGRATGAKQEKADPDGRVWVPGEMTGNDESPYDRGMPWRGFKPKPGRMWYVAKPVKVEYEARTGCPLEGTLQEMCDALDREGLIVWPKKAGAWPKYKLYRDRQEVVLQEIWDDISCLRGAKEALGFEGQKPVALLERIIAASSNPGDIVLDPFMGTGTTGEAAKNLGRHFIGIEQNPVTAELAMNRLGLGADLLLPDEARVANVDELAVGGSVGALEVPAPQPAQVENVIHEGADQLDVLPALSGAALDQAPANDNEAETEGPDIGVLASDREREKRTHGFTSGSKLGTRGFPFRWRPLFWIPRKTGPPPRQAQKNDAAVRNSRQSRPPPGVLKGDEQDEQPMS